MNSPSQQGYLVLADISGFIPFLSGVELEHAQAILSELFDLLIRRLEPVLKVSQLYGDAVLAYRAESHQLKAELLLETIESTYAAFRDRLEGIRRRTTCTCRACRAVPNLDLKFLVHYGQYTQHTLRGKSELMGLDVDLVRTRLLKDQVGSESDDGAYVLFTGQSMAEMGLESEGMSEQTGTYEHYGQIKTYKLDLRVRYQVMVATRKVFVRPEEAYSVHTCDIEAPPAVVWQWLNDTEKRTRWMRGRKWSAVWRPGGRMGVGARNHCAHGIGSIAETVLDWRPFDYFTVELIPSLGHWRIIQTYQLEPLGAGHGTRLHSHIKLLSPLPEWLVRPLCNMGVTLLLKSDSDRLARLITAEAATSPA
jgi:uncharacterized protein DUF2652/polyketide cyclase/dehydrase/lipid transport protein